MIYIQVCYPVGYGEDKPNSDIEYSGITGYDGYPMLNKYGCGYSG
ncbi:hypothetical protein [uncultured Parabacteroides sp.]|nr:hypothetical protein [uncultured Parabacteroides sp.]